MPKTALSAVATLHCEEVVPNVFAFSDTHKIQSHLQLSFVDHNSEKTPHN